MSNEITETFAVGSHLLEIDPEAKKLKSFVLNPNAYQKAVWQGTTSITSDGRIGIRFELENGVIIRLEIDKKSANQLQGSINDNFYWKSLSQSERESEMSKVEESTPEELDQP